jgi:hypothetical protein
VTVQGPHAWEYMRQKQEHETDGILPRQGHMLNTPKLSPKHTSCEISALLLLPAPCPHPHQSLPLCLVASIRSLPNWGNRHVPQRLTAGGVSGSGSAGPGSSLRLRLSITRPFSTSESVMLDRRRGPGSGSAVATSTGIASARCGHIARLGLPTHSQRAARWSPW